MGSGEADAYHMRSLDAFRACAIDGCPWHVRLPETRCYQHGGGRTAQYATSADGEILDARFTPAQATDDQPPSAA